MLFTRAAASFGYELTPLPVKSERLDIHLGRLFRILQINCVLDVGANRGQYGNFLRQMGYKGRIVSFEPVKDDFAVLRQCAAADPEWDVYRFALGDQDRITQMNVTSDSLFNSFLTPNEFIKGQGLRVDHVEKVQERRLDTVWDEIIAPVREPKVYVKVDTQGYDRQVFEGGEKALTRILALQSEVSVKPVYDEMPYFLDAISALYERGFELTGLFPVARDNVLRVVEFDCVMVRTDAVGETKNLQAP